MKNTKVNTNPQTTCIQGIEHHQNQQVRFFIVFIKLFHLHLFDPFFYISLIFGILFFISLPKETF